MSVRHQRRSRPLIQRAPAPARKRCTCSSPASTGHVREEEPSSDWCQKLCMEGGATCLSITAFWAGPGRASLAVGQSQGSGTQSLRCALAGPRLLQCGPLGDGCWGARRPFLFPVASGWRAGRRPPVQPGASHSPSRRGAGGWRRWRRPPGRRRCGGRGARQRAVAARRGGPAATASARPPEHPPRAAARRPR